MTDLALIILAAGKGTRMKSALPKVMHKLAGRTLLGHVLQATKSLEASRTILVVGPDMEEVGKEARRFVPTAETVVQTSREGTGHAVLMAKEKLANFTGTILILYADVPLIETAALQAMVDNISPQQPAAVLGFDVSPPTGYGRLLLSAHKTVTEIREELDASPQEKAITLCNSGIISIQSDLLWPALAKVQNHNAKQEYYLTDIIKIISSDKHAVGLVQCPAEMVAGINDRVQLSQLEHILQQKYRQAAMLKGATLIDPGSVYFAADTLLGQDVVIEPNVFFGPGVTVSDGVHILANCHIEGASIASGARIGPFARLRPEAHISENAHIGNFVEIKKAHIGKGAKANHLSYIGDAVVGAASNIGAGTITCNYDGYEKHQTQIGENVFVGSNSSLVAPVTIAAGVNIGAGSVITSNIPADALAMTRSELQIRNGWAKRYRDLKQARKAARKS